MVVNWDNQGGVVHQNRPRSPFNKLTGFVQFTNSDYTYQFELGYMINLKFSLNLAKVKLSQFLEILNMGMGKRRMPFYSKCKL